MDTCEYELDSCCNSTVQIALFRNVQNTRQLKDMLLSGQLRCCIVKPSLILDPFQIVVAVNKAVVCEKERKMTTRSVFTETLYNLSISKNISQSLEKFGIGVGDGDLLLVVIRRNADSTMESIKPVVVGDLCSIDKLKAISDLALIKKTYSIKEEELEASTLLDSIVSRISAKDVFAFKT